MEIIKIIHIYDFISLFPLVLYVYTIIEFYKNNNIYLLSGCILSYIIHRVIKNATHGYYPEYFKRPDNATDTNIFNTGGFSGNNPGFPSGHVLTTAFVLYYLIFIENQSLLTLDSINKQIIIIIIAYARVKKSAHKIIQVIAGYIIGLVLAHYIVFLEKNL